MGIAASRLATEPGTPASARVERLVMTTLSWREGTRDRGGDRRRAIDGPLRTA